MFRLLKWLLGRSGTDAGDDCRLDQRFVSYCSLPSQESPGVEGEPEAGKGKGSGLDIPAGTVEKRHWVRFACNVSAECRPEVRGSETHWSARAQNVSRGGLELAIERRFERGTMLTITVANRDFSTSPTLMARVVRVWGTVDHRWILGCRFLHELGEDELLDFLGNPPDRERDTRMSRL